jgi:hypothetical protein
MSAAATDPVTLTLTGVLPAIVIAAAALAYPIARLLLRLYRRSVARAMAASGSGAIAAPPQLVQLPPRTNDTSELQFLLRAPRQAAAVYAAAGGAYAAVMTIVLLLAAPEHGIFLNKVLVVLWPYWWPAVLTISLVTRARLLHWRAVCAYLAVFALIVARAVAYNPSLPWYGLPLHWLLVNGPPTALLAGFLSRHIRAIGPIVFSYTFLALMGSQVLFTFAGANDALLQSVARPAFALGLRAIDVFVGIHLIGLLAFGVAGWFFLKWLGRAYERKRFSDEMLTVDAVWLLFAVVQSVGFVFQGLLWFCSGFVAFAAYKAAAMLGFALLRRRARPAPRTLLLLRVFALSGRSEQLFDVLRTRWLRLGSMTLIAGPDLMTATVEPHEFLHFLSGELSRDFVSDGGDLRRRIEAMDAAEDPDGRFRVNEFFCHADTWQATMQALSARCDAVLMDLRSFSRANAGCLFELGVLLNTVDPARVLFLIDATTDRSLLESCIAGSPNVGAAAPAIRLLDVASSISMRVVRSLLAQLTLPPAPPPARSTPLP